MQSEPMDARKKSCRIGPRFPLLASRFHSLFLALAALLALPLFPAPARALTVLFSATDRSRTIFPSDVFTTPDPEMITGLRVALPDQVPKGTTISELIRELSELDGFACEPRIAIPFDGPVDPRDLTSANIFALALTGPDRGLRLGLDMTVYDPKTNLFAAHLDAYLHQSATYGVIVLNTVRDPQGRPLAVNPEWKQFLSAHPDYSRKIDELLRLAREKAGIEPATLAAASVFTTQSITYFLERVRQDLDSGAAIEAAGIADPGARFDLGLSHERTVFRADEVKTILRRQQILTKGALSTAKPIPMPLNPDWTLAFGSFESPEYRESQHLTFPPVPSRTGAPRPQGKNTVYFNLLLPPGTPPDRGWPLIVYGHGFGGNKNDQFQVDEQFIAAGYAVVHINVPGFAGGPGGRLLVETRDGKRIALPDGGRAVANALPGVYLSRVGGFFAKVRSNRLPVGHRDGMRQEVIDLMRLVRVFQAGVDVNNDGRPDVDAARVYYTGSSLGGCYGAIFTAMEPSVYRSVPNVGGGPIFQIRMLPIWKNFLIRPFLLFVRPPIFNSGLFNFAEDLPQRGQPLYTVRHKGALQVQDFFDLAEWLQEPGDPDEYARYLVREPLFPAGPRQVAWYVAFGDDNMANPLSANVARAGGLEAMTACFRPDLVPATYGFAWPREAIHYFMRRPSTEKNLGPVSVQARELVIRFFQTGELIDPDGAKPVFEVPIQPETLRRMQTGTNLK